MKQDYTCDWQNNVLKDAQVIKPRAHEYVILVTWHKEIEVADGIKVANQLIGTN